MKTIYLKTICLLFIAFAITSCTKNKDTEPCDPNDEESPCYAGPSGGHEGNQPGEDDQLLLIEWKLNGQTIETYTYNGQNLLTAVRLSGSSSGFDITRDPAGRMTRLDHIGPDGDVNLREEYSYGGADNKPVSGSLFDPNDDSDPISIQYTYAQNTVMETFISDDGEDSVTNTYTFDSKGNLLQANMTSTNSVLENSDYDDKHANSASYPWSWKISSVNNPQAVKTTSPGGVTDRIFEYTYNEAGYPVKAEVSDRGSNVVVETHEYFYKKAN